MDKLLFIHSAGPQERQEGSSGLITYVKQHLGKEYEVIHPNMPTPEAPRYQEWKKVFEANIRSIHGEVVLVGHSMGGAFLVKYLSEESITIPISGLYIIASPFWGLDEEWQSCDDFFLQKGFENKLPEMKELVFYHSRNEEIVPYSHLEHYTKKIHRTEIRDLNGSEHLFQNGLPELVQDIKNAFLKS
ncbi:alpha/beta fold hydrolase [Sutcliffiella halmapala]|uniref:alpha/beta fold hydrolase n=1 Tax=Sutcliffiella halmapala TaxID=79882 RepID=UPI000995208A|nr:alpha/beta fold hydrolase [Sutcliffiella halmapala]